MWKRNEQKQTPKGRRHETAHTRNKVDRKRTSCQGKEGFIVSRPKGEKRKGERKEKKERKGKKTEGKSRRWKKKKMPEKEDIDLW